MPRTRLSALLLSLLVSLPVPGTAQEATPADDPSHGVEIMTADGVDLDAFAWTNRVLVVFADTPADPRFDKQMQLIGERPRDLIERDVVVITDTDPAARSAIRSKLRPRGFALVLIDKDGVVKLRKPTPWSTREIGRSIDKTPLRRQEIRERGAGAGG